MISFKRILPLVLLAMGVIVANAAEAVIDKKGPAGPAGATGKQGPAGPAGAIGPTGPTGPASTVAGPTGPEGPASTVAGPAGPTGPTGPEGPASTVAGPAGTFPDGNVAGDMQYWDGYDWVMVPAPVFTSTTANPPEMATLHFCSNSIAPTWKAACDRIPTPPAIGTCVGLSGQVVGSNIEYTFNGKLNDQFGTLPIGTPFTGKLTYPIQAMNPSVFSPTVRGDYIADSITLTIDGVTVSETGGTINIYDDTYPTDLFAYYTLSAINGTLGGLTISPSSGIQLILQDISKTAWSSVALPGSELTMTNLTSGNATFIQLQSVNNLSGPGMATIARGELCP